MVPVSGVRVVRHVDLVAVPWRNGLGLTREVAREQDPRDSASFRWRVSIADVQGDAPFSSFPGVDRVAVLLDDATVGLTVDDVLTRMTPFTAVAFAGEAATTMHVAGDRVRLLNVMTTRTSTRADVQVVRGRTLDVGDTTSTHLVVVLQGAGLLLLDPGQPALTTHDAVLVPGGAKISLDLSAGIASVIRFT